MSEGTPERLKEFRAQYRAGARSAGILRVAVPLALVAGIALGTLGARLFLREGASADAARGMSAEKWREYAVYLEGKQLPAAAVNAYARYLDKAVLSDAERARVCYAVAKLAAGNDDFDMALAYLYESEMLDPDSDLKDDIGKKVVLCLDRLGRKGELRRELRERADLKKTEKDVQPGEKILAQFGDEVLTDRDLQREIDKLPASAQSSLDSPEKKAQFLENLVARRLLVEKALRLELDHDPEIEAQLAAQRDGLIVAKLVDEQLAKEGAPTPEDAERFYKAEPGRFKKAGSDTVPPFEQVKQQALQMLKAQKRQEGLDRLVAETIKERDVHFYPERLKTAEDKKP